jgi:hypothetical protein
MHLLLILQLISRPNIEVTPGFLRALNKTAICNIKWGLDRRHVTIKMKKKVFENYHIDWSTRKLYEVDHLIPRELGGADTVSNLWPEVCEDAHKKDKVENQLHRAVCKNTITLHDAQEQMRNWGK